MRYLKTRWVPGSRGYPAWILSELDDVGAHRRIEVFADGRMKKSGLAASSGHAPPGEAPPPLGEADPESDTHHMSRADFDRLWDAPDANAWLVEAEAGEAERLREAASRPVKTLHELLTEVRDRETFVRFVEALAEERERAEEIERANPGVYVVDGALDWKNGDIGGFLYAALQYFQPGTFHRPESEPSWRMFADFLYFGKIYE